ncbi:Receptor-interacting serine/threonine-protein kinase 1, partial [Marasmius crinis-equi]
MSSNPELKRLEQTLKWTFKDKSRLQGFLAKKGPPAQRWLDRMQQLVDSPDISSEMRSSVFSVILRLSKNSGLHPQCLAIQNVKKFGEYPIDAGGFGEVWKGVIGDSSQHVCLKVVKIYQDSNIEQISKSAAMFNFSVDEERKLGSILEGDATRRCGPLHIGRLSVIFMAHDVAAGLSYLHSEKIVHSDLKGVNVLITDTLRACIADFGLSRVTNTCGVKITSTNSRTGGTGRWLAPELLFDGGVTSRESDVYALGCVYFEIFTGQQPFPNLPHDAAVVLAVSSGKRPLRPEGIPQLTDAIWKLTQSCWDPTPASRPTASHVVDEILSFDTSNSITPAPKWNESTFTQVWGNVEYPAAGTPSPNTPPNEINATRIPSPSKTDLLSPSDFQPSHTDQEDYPSPADGIVKTAHSHDSQIQARAIYNCTASPNNPHEISFAKGEILNIIDRRGKWWSARKADGTVGIAPSNYLQTIDPGSEPEPEPPTLEAKAIYAYTANPDDPHEISFTKGEILNIINRTGKWWNAQKADGTVG